MTMTFAEAAETVLRDQQRAMKPADLWAEISRRALVETDGVTPIATLTVELLRKSANSSAAKGKGEPRFYRNGDGGFGLWAELSPEQRRAVRPSVATNPPGFGREFRQDRDGMRRQPEIARQVLEHLVPDAGPRRAVALLLADLIRAAHAHGVGIWKLTLGVRSLRLAVGRAILATVEKDGFWFVADLAAITDDQRALLEGLTTPDLATPAYRSLPDTSFRYAPPDALVECGGAILSAVTPVMAVASRGFESVVGGPRLHSPGAVEMLEQLTGTSLPRPEHPEAGDDEGGEDDEVTLDDLLEEYIAHYAVTDEGRAFLATYDEERATARANWEQIEALEQRGDDVTDALLYGALPHADTEKHRERGAWVSHAPVILGDLRTYFERGGRVEAEAWPAVARTVLGFLRACLREPEALAAHVVAFLADPRSKGFNVGTLTPFLSAMDPDRLPLVNGKVLRVLNYFAGTALKPDLTEYPQAIAAIHELVAAHPLLADPRLGGVRPGDVFDHFCHWLISIRRYTFPEVDGEDEVACWKISPGRGAEHWDRWRAEGVAEIGWNLLGDLSEVKDEEDFRTRVAMVVPEESYKLAGARQAWNLARMPVGTLLVANRGTSEVLGIGRVTGPYRFVDNGELRHQVPVEWYDTRVRAVDRPGWVKSLMSLERSTFDELVSLPGTESRPPAPDITTSTPRPPPPVAPPSYTREQFVAETGLASAEAERWLRILQAKRQVIIQGPPGTGKTYVAERLAKLLVGGATERVQLVQFHPAYSYEDFIQGIRPRVVGQALSYDLVGGRFLAFCDAATSPAPYVLIIDEINRANLPRVLGELMYLLEYRDKTVPLASGGELRIPGHVHLIGTMNTADRSIARLDHALRRRFSFLRLQPNHGVLRDHGRKHDVDVIEPLIDTLARINRAIDDPNFELGISYFLRADLEDALEDIWTCEIEPYLEEYFYDRPGVIKEFRWTALATGPFADWRRDE